MAYSYTLTIRSQIHASELMGPYKLLLEVTLEVYKYGWQITVRKVWDASCGDALEELCGWELHRQLRQVLVEQRTQRDPART
jgi:hypothetical protein